DRLEAIFGAARIAGNGWWRPASGEIAADVDARSVPLTLVAASDRVAGHLDARASLGGSLPRVSGDASFEIPDLSVMGEPVPALRGTAAADGRRLEMEVAFIDHTATATATLDLEDELLPLAALVDLEALPQSLLEALGSRLPLDADLTALEGRIRVDVPLRDPDAFRVAARDVAAAALYGGRDVSLQASFALDGERLLVDGAELSVDHERLRASGSLGLEADAPVDLTVRGSLPLGLFDTLNLSLEGVAQLDGEITGTAGRLDVRGTLEVAGASGRLGELTWQDLDLRARGEGDRIVVEAIRVDALEGTLEANGEFPLPHVDGELPWMEAVFRDLDIYSAVPSIRELESGARFVVSGDARITGPPLELAELEGSLRFTEVEIGFEDRAVTNAQPIVATLADGRLTIDGFRMAGAETDVRLDASASVVPFGDVEGRLTGELDLANLALLAAALPGVRVSGVASLDVRVSQSNGELTLSGGGSLHDGRIAARRPAFAITDLAGELRFSGQRIAIEGLEGRIGGGTVSGGGTVDLGGPTGLDRADLSVAVRDVNLQIDEGARARFSGDARFHGGGQQYTLSGDLRILGGLFTQPIEGSTSQQESFAAVRAVAIQEEGDEEPFSERVALDLRLATDGDIRVRNETMRFAAAGDLRVTGTMAEPEVRGAIATTSQGELRLGRHLFDLRTARVQLDGFPTVPPRLDVTAVTEVDGYTVQVEVLGTPDDIETRMSSPDSSLTQADLSSLLISGRRADAADPNNEAMLQASAASYLGDMFGQKLGLGLVFDTPAALPVLASETDPENMFTVGRRLSSNFTVAYSVSMDQNESQLWILDYQPAHRLWLRA
ncbi:MAG: translocation/assembly module TamB domain-containing protein, partial [Thermoanaerobaculia bacterium]|nr:translocation/assembly module TamB domain-containing protein [Thermoanaerobaculia bacterium]